MCQGLGPTKHDEISEIDRTRSLLEDVAEHVRKSSVTRDRKERDQNCFALYYRLIYTFCYIVGGLLSIRTILDVPKPRCGGAPNLCEDIH